MTNDPAPAAVEPLTIATTDGVELVAEVAVPGGPTAVVVACHPHPLYGGSMHANVVDALFRALPSDGAAVLRFNFRGANGSGGTHDEGRAERLDVEAAVATAAHRWPDVPLLLAGYSFGADVSLAAAPDSVAGWLAVAPPLRIVALDDMAALGDPRPKTVVAAEHDQFNPYDQAVSTLDGYPSVTTVEAKGADHFFAIGLDTVVTAARTALTEI